MNKIMTLPAALIMSASPVAHANEQKPTSAPRITVEGRGDDAKLVITTDARDGGLLFKFGSVVGLYSGPGGANIRLPQDDKIEAPYDSKTDVAFNPTRTAEFEWKGIPYANGPYDVDADYHTLENVQAGRGDPCRLVGYTARQIREATEVPDNGIWRLPTAEENRQFTGYKDMHNWNGPAPFIWTNEKSPFAGVAGAEFPKRKKGGAEKFLPAVGNRSGTDGSLSIWCGFGYYWSNEYFGVESSGYHLNFYYNPHLGSRLNLYGSHQEFARTIRCVRQ